MTLEDILAAAAEESKAREERYPLSMIRRKVEKMSATRGFARALLRKPFSIIAEIKRRSPSMGVIREDAINWAHQIYAKHPVVSAISVLTQHRFFGGVTDDLENVRKNTQNCPKPILRKDFIFSEYEIFFSRWIGADAILLMANVVEDKTRFKALHDLALSIGLDVLCEVHDESEIALLPQSVKICGVNSRRFKGVKQRERTRPLAGMLDVLFRNPEKNRDTQTDLATFQLYDKLMSELPAECIKVAESGISPANVARVLERFPYHAALVGTSLLRSGMDMPAMLDKFQSESAAALGKAGACGVDALPSYA